MGKFTPRDKPTNFNREDALRLREQTQKTSPQRQERILQHVKDHPEEEHTIHSLSMMGAKSFEESLRNFKAVHDLITAKKLARKDRLHPALTFSE